jgi:ferredoxin
MPLFEIDQDKCIGCGTCIDECPVGALSLEVDVVTSNENCSACWVCVDACPVEAFKLSERKT